ncbi:MAG: hypothetical protein AAGI23_08260 [Bacteroidota bacterium]
MGILRETLNELKAKNISIVEVAEKIGVSRAQIYKIADGGSSTRMSESNVVDLIYRAYPDVFVELDEKLKEDFAVQVRNLNWRIEQLEKELDKKENEKMLLARKLEKVELFLHKTSDYEIAN